MLRPASYNFRLTGQPLVGATRYEQEVLRCSACQERFTAPLPAGVRPEKYDETCDVSLALAKYGQYPQNIVHSQRRRGIRARVDEVGCHRQAGLEKRLGATAFDTRNLYMGKDLDLE